MTQRAFFVTHSPRLRLDGLIFLLTILLLGARPSLAQSTESDSKVRQPWAMHHINDDYAIANSLNQADVDKDGYPDYAVIDERLGIQTIVFHPGKNGNPEQSWERVNLGKADNPEYSCLGDLDDDGNVDFVVVTGDDLEQGYTTGVGVYWGPEAARVKDSTAWENGGFIESTKGQQYLYAETYDINGDGALDILVGGRRNAMTNQYAGIRWLEAPKDKAARRDLTQWTSHFVDADAYSGHGFVFTDINQDGYEDIVIANADWDTPAFEEELYWYEHPGENTEAVNKPWPRHSIWKDAQFYPKPQIGVGDLNGDGRNDLCTQTQNYIHLFLNTSEDSVTWRHVEIKKPEMIQWIGRPIKFQDVNQDGRLDIVGMLIHNDGNLPANKASVFWMEYEDPESGKNWTTHPIKWGDGYNSYHQWLGEKWDHCLFYDVDDDGDQDIVGNVEEHYQYNGGKAPKSFFSVVWFENPLR